jgi:membrane fusion protein, copper/silver efflux system
MKRKWKNNLMAAMSALFLVLTFHSCENKKTAALETYTCPMHPTVVSEKPGTCPVCGMDLVVKGRKVDEQSAKDLAYVIQSTNESVVSDIKTIKPTYKAVAVRINAQGSVTYDTRNLYSIPTRISGRLEKIFLRKPYQQVVKGQKVAEIYSPEMNTAQRELIFLLENDAQNSSLINAAKNKLRLMGLAENQINSISAKKEIGNTVSIFSSVTGYLIPDAPMASTEGGVSTQPSGNGEMGDGMNNNSSEVGAGGKIEPVSFKIPREGNYVSAGQTLFRIADNSSMRIEIDVPIEQSYFLRKGNTVVIDTGEGTHEVTIDFIEPFLDENQGFAKVRVNTREVAHLHIGHLVKAEIKADSAEGLWVPRDAVVDLGKQTVVFVKEGKVFKPRDVKVREIGSEYQILNGVTTSDEIAFNARFLIDSESIIKNED